LRFKLSNFFRRAAPSRRALSAAFLLLSICCLSLAAFGSPLASRWTRQRSGTLAWLHGVFFVDESRGWAVGSKGALLSTVDGGATWRVLPPPSPDALRDIFFEDAERGWIVCERSIYLLKEKTEPRSYLLRTTDGGRTWARVEVTGADVDARLVGVRFAEGGRGWAYGEMGTLYATKDGGETWARRRVPTRHLLLDAHLLDAQRGWLAGAGSTLLRTEDGGETWHAGHVLIANAAGAAPALSAQARASEASSVRLNAVEFADARTGWAVGAGGRIYATADGGRTWRPQSSGINSDLYDVKFLDARTGWVVGGDGTVLRTIDGGRTWLAETPQTPHTLERLFFIGRTRAWAVGFGGTIIGLRD
jgi:photosystem II stability/assembly factor-like uncharacterized protein